MSPKKGPFQKERIVFPTTDFSEDIRSFSGEYLDLMDQVSDLNTTTGDNDILELCKGLVGGFNPFKKY